MEPQHNSAWKFLIGVFVAFWILFAIVLWNANIPFVIVVMALSMVLAMSAVVVSLAWAYQHNV